MNDQQFPKADAGTFHPELFIRDVDFLNYHINHDKWNWFRNFDVIDTVRWFDDFTFDEVDLYTTAASAGGAKAIADMVNGVCTLTPHTDDDDYCEFAGDAEWAMLTDGFPLYFEARFKLADVDDCDFYIGLINSAGYFSAPPTDGVFFLVNDGDASLTFVVRDGSANTAVDTGVDLVNVTWIRVAFHWDGAGTIRWFVFTDSVAPQVCAATGSVTAGFAQDEELNFASGVRNGSGAAKVAYLDYYKVAMRRNI
jgi:hypothetical protein